MNRLFVYNRYSIFGLCSSANDLDRLILQAHDQLRAVLLTLLEELPSDLPVLLLGVSVEAPDQLDKDVTLIFPPRTVYVLLISRL